jgi:cysteine-S-conjugate beta-lyase
MRLPSRSPSDRGHSRIGLMSEPGLFDFDTVIDREPTASYKWAKYRGRDVIPLWVADMDFRSAPAIVEAMQERVAHGVFGYTHAPDDLVAAVIASLEAEYGWLVDPSWIVWLPGVVSGLNVLCRAVGEPGDAVMTLTPVYPPFMSAPCLADRDLIGVPLVLREGGYGADLEALEQAVTPRTRLLLLCSPHNPVGRVWSEEELRAFARLAERHDLIIGSDEIHAGLILDEDKPHIPTATLSAGIASRTVTLMAASKTFNTPGLGCSFAVIGDPRLRWAFSRAMEGIVPHVNALGYTATQAAYEKGGEWRMALLDYLRGNRDLAERGIAAMPGLVITHAEATYLAWIDARPTGLADPATFFENAGVGLSDGAEFGAPGFLRLNFGCPRSLLTKALDRMRDALRRGVESGMVKS